MNEENVLDYLNGIGYTLISGSDTEPTWRVITPPGYEAASNTPFPRIMYYGEDRGDIPPQRIENNFNILKQINIHAKVHKRK